jgi:hypothetical protein
MPIHVIEGSRTPNRTKIEPLWSIIVRILSIENKERILKAVRRSAKSLI